MNQHTSALGLAVILVVCISTTAKGVSLQQVGKIAIAHPSFIELFPRVLGGPDALFTTEFAPFSAGKVHFIDDIFSHASQNFTGTTVQTLSASFKWPNRITPIPAGALKFNASFNGIVVPDGFLVPGSSDGGLYLLQTDVMDADPVRIDSGPSGWFYHSALWRDMNGDGLLDLLTARAHKPIFGAGGGKLLWLEQPSSGTPFTKWTEHIITEGPDILFAVIDTDNTTNTYSIYSPEFFGKRLSLTTVDRKGNLVKYVVADSNTGPGYDVDVADLNADGHVDLLVTNHEGGKGGSVFAYAGPDFQTKHTIATGFDCTVSTFNCGAPGLAYAVFPASGSNPMPHILVAGDGSGAAYLMAPTAPFTYNGTVITNPGKTVGALGVKYIGSSQPLSRAKYVFVPVYETGVVMPFEFV